MTEWTGLTLAERCRRFEIRYPERRLTIYRLLKVYRESGIRRKKIKRTKLIDDQKREQIREQAVEAWERV